ASGAIATKVAFVRASRHVASAGAVMLWEASPDASKYLAQQVTTAGPRRGSGWRGGRATGCRPPPTVVAGHGAGAGLRGACPGPSRRKPRAPRTDRGRDRTDPRYQEPTPMTPREKLALYMEKLIEAIKAEHKSLAKDLEEVF